MDPISAIGNNAAAGRVSHALAEAYSQVQKTFGRLSSGKRIVRPQDDAAGLAQLAKLESQISQTNAGSSNVANATSFTGVQEGFRAQIQQVASDLGAQAIRSQDATLNAGDKANIQAVADTEQQFINSSLGAEFNGVALFSPTNLTTATGNEGGNVTLNAVNLGANVAGGGVAEIAGGLSLANPTALTTINAAINNLASAGANIGATQAQLNITGQTNAIRVENLSAAASRIGDADIAQESANLSRHNTAVQAGALNLARANAALRSRLNVLA